MEEKSTSLGNEGILRIIYKPTNKSHEYGVKLSNDSYFLCEREGSVGSEIDDIAEGFVSDIAVTYPGKSITYEHVKRDNGVVDINVRIE
jgi:hypothetical protein